MNNLEVWNKLKQPPPSALKPIMAGRLKGKSDINPQWRYQALTEQFGPCGIGWKFEVVKLWTEPASDGQVFAFAEVRLYVTADPVDSRGAWSEAIPGIGGSLLLQKESGGIHANDEAYKMAVTDALGTAMKMLGVAADVYAGLWDGTKYRDAPQGAPQTRQMAPGSNGAARPTQPPPTPTNGGWSGVNVKGRAFQGTGRPLPQGWFQRLKEDRAAAIEEIGGASFGAEKNPAGKWEIVHFTEDRPHPADMPDSAFDPNDDVPF